jgi:hypothetical protein
MNGLIVTIAMMCIHPLPNNEWNGEWCALGPITSTKQPDNSYVYCSNWVIWRPRDNHMCYIADMPSPAKGEGE